MTKKRLELLEEKLELRTKKVTLVLGRHISIKKYKLNNEDQKGNEL